MKIKLIITFIANFLIIHLFSQEKNLLFREESDNIYLYKKAIIRYLKMYNIDTLYFLDNDEIDFPKNIKKCVLIKVDSNISNSFKSILSPNIIKIKPIEIKNGEIIISIKNFGYSRENNENIYYFGKTFDYIFIYNFKNKKYVFLKEKVYYY